MKKNYCLWTIIALPVLAGCGTAPPTTMASATSTPAPSAAQRPTQTKPTTQPTGTPEPTPVDTDGRVLYEHEGLIVYGLEGNLCVIKGGEPPVFLAGASDIFYPNASQVLRDGGRIGYGTVDVSTDLAMVAFRTVGTKGNESLWVANVDGSDVRELFVADPSGVRSGLNILQWEWIPGTHQIALTTGHEYGPQPSNDLYIVDANTNTTANILTAGSGGQEFHISPDGQHIAVVAGGSISLIDPDGTDWHENVFAYQPIVKFLEGSAVISGVWAADSSGLWVAVPAPNLDERGLATWFIPVDGSLPIALNHFDDVIVTSSFTLFSPDGKYIAFGGPTADSESPHLHIMAADGSSDMLVPSPADIFVHWEPDSRHFIHMAIEDHDYDSVILYRGGVGEESVQLPAPELPAQGCAPDS